MSIMSKPEHMTVNIVVLYFLRSILLCFPQRLGQKSLPELHILHGCLIIAYHQTQKIDQSLIIVKH